ncbi:MAG: O-antigen ligase family protein [Ardenticatenaceae bacterium]|nr:O-antigen ligase family protein [Ardenticatenaceae bacterium]
MSGLLVRVCRGITAVEWLVLAALLPLVLFPSPVRAAALLVIPVLWLARWGATGHLIPPTPVDWSLLGLLLMALVSEYATYDMANSLGKLVGLVYGVAVFYAVVQWAGKAAARLWWGVAVLYAAVAGLAAASLVLFGWIGSVPGLGGLLARVPAQITALAPASGAVNPNEVAGALLWLLPLAALLAATAVLRFRVLARRFHWWGAALLVVLLAGIVLGLLGVLVLTRSRAALLGMAAALVLMGAVGLTAVSRKLAVALVVGGLIVVVVGVLAVGPERVTAVFFAQAGLDSGDPLNTLAGREEIWSRAIYGLQDFPFTGMGMNNFRQVVHILYPLFLVSPDTDIAHAHNHWLQAGLDLGIPGMIAYMALWLGLAVMLWQVWRQARDGWLRVLALGLAGCLAAYFVYGLVDTVALGARPGFVFWGLVGLIGALHRVGNGER